ncbi:adenosine kinase [Aureimonas fodinaquatilis]|uniref:Adenosine kinase n=1 Tax=Aureimonas fodinaquatilis TaxID=2565783 RepID=A0A5B0E0R9_9HYPH|nr:adenosine kinase [Aureimonas fodinaquatilis]KAA0971715.1 adenosine kinase [Aureimonas fodinaquatilis]
MPKFDVLTIGNAIVDIIARTDDATLKALNVQKGAMTLVDAERALQLYANMGPAIETSGGSAANTVAGLVALGGKGAFIGKVSGDTLGEIFIHDIRSLGVFFATSQLIGDPPTARCMIFVTPDGERSMSTYLGACVELRPEDIEPELVAGAQVSYFEGYLWDPPLAKEAIVKSADIAHAHGREMAMTLSDAFCVNRYRNEFLGLMQSGTVDIVFANEAEALALYETEDFSQALLRLQQDVAKLAVVTRGAQGCVVVEKAGQTAYAAEPVARVVDTTGAGDLFAAGFLRGYTSGRDHATSAALGASAAAHIIQQIGPRPATLLTELPAVKALL